MKHQTTPQNYKIPFLVVTVICVMLLATLAATVMPDIRLSSSSPLVVTEGKITELLSVGDLYSSLIVMRTDSGRDVTVRVTTDTKIYDEEGEPVLSSGLSVGRQIRVSHTNFMNAESVYKEDGTPVPPVLRECPEICVLQEEPAG